MFSFRKGILEELGYEAKFEVFDEEWKDLLDKLYNKSGMSTTCIGQMLGICPGTIREDMKKLGLETIGWRNYRKNGGMGLPRECFHHGFCIYCKKEISTIYSKEVTCKDPACKRKFYNRNRDKKKRDRYNEDFV